MYCKTFFSHEKYSQRRPCCEGCGTSQVSVRLSAMAHWKADQVLFEMIQHTTGNNRIRQDQPHQYSINTTAATITNFHNYNQ